MSAQTEVADDLLTVDELAAATGLTVRTTRYYATLGLLPAPTRRGRMAYYGASHRARLELIIALQEHGFTLSAIQTYLSRLPEDATVEDLAVQRAMLTSWAPGNGEALTRRQLELRAGRKLTDDDVELLIRILAVRRAGGAPDRFEVMPPFATSLEVLSLGIPVESVVEASAAIMAHMDALADELTEVLRRGVLAPFREQRATEADTVRFEQTMSRLRQLTLEAVVTGFQRAADQVISRSLSGSTEVSSVEGSAARSESQ